MSTEPKALADTMAARYDPANVEARWYSRWEQDGAFRCDPSSAAKAFTIVIPPPNVTGALHMGHALNNTIQDVLIRFRRMQGLDALWIPGTDHAGIATQNVVERKLRDEGRSRETLGREGFLREVWAWKERYGGTILRQLRRLGASCDWERERFTMDPGLSRAVREAFVRLHEQGLLYRGPYIVNWCPKDRTALADDEVERQESEGSLWHIRYPAADGTGHLSVATTRPETMLGDTAVAVNPHDERHRGWIGRRLRLPLLGREIPVVGDDVVDQAFGTGAVKVTPAHDPVDFEIARRHSLPHVPVLDGGGTVTEAGGPYAGLDRFEARKRVVGDLEAQGLLERVEPHRLALGRCYRCGTVIEPLESTQWFVRMEPLARKAIEATRAGRVRFHPERWTAVYLQWLENVRDWCVSRQIWWGHRVPVWHCLACGHEMVCRQDPDGCSRCASDRISQDEDVLDTWFSSALWPFSTLGWPAESETLRRYYPTSVLVTDRGIIYFWVARMVMMGLAVMQEAPFGDVYIHGTILDENGAKMSKSAGNGIDPLVMMDGGEQPYLGKVYHSPGYGADAVRLSLAFLATEGQDLKLSPTRFEMGRNFVNKLWNAARFARMNLGERISEPVAGALPAGFPLEDRWILSRLRASEEAVTGALEQFRFHAAATALYDFTWRDFCDWYVEAAKGRLKGPPVEADPARRIVATVLDRLLRLLHPFAPFVTEEIASLLGFTGGRDRAKTLIAAPWPTSEEAWRDESAEREMGMLQGIVGEIRRYRTEAKVHPAQRIGATLARLTPVEMDILRRNLPLVRDRAMLNACELRQDAWETAGKPTCLFGSIAIHLDAGARAEEAARRHDEKRRAELKALLAGIDAKLGSPAFVEKAPPAVVAKERRRRDEFARELASIEEPLA